ncbi:type II secretion system protein M [Marinobacteraceae bacterium S3BR75-40.1]
MWSRIERIPAIQKFTAKYDHLPRRDQKALQLLGIALLLFVVYFLIWRPAHQFQVEQQDRLENARDLLAFVQANKSRVAEVAKQRQGQGASQIDDTRSLLSTVTSTANESGLSLQRFEPSGEQRIRVWLDDVAFTGLAGWLEKLNTQYGIEVEQASLDRTDNPGQVTARLTLMTP